MAVGIKLKSYLLVNMTFLVLGIQNGKCNAYIVVELDQELNFS
jgi:hypothetical protein